MADRGLPHVWVSFDLTGDAFDPEVVTSELGIEPTSHHRAGNAILGEQGHRVRDRWRVTVGPRDTIEIGGMLKELLARLSPAEQELGQICRRLGLSPMITCAIEPTSSLTPNLTLSPEVIRWAAEHETVIAVDVMLWGDDAHTGN